MSASGKGFSSVVQVSHDAFSGGLRRSWAILLTNTCIPSENSDQNEAGGSGAADGVVPAGVLSEEDKSLLGI
jgi:hypothetical protein